MYTPTPEVQHMKKQHFKPGSLGDILNGTFPTRESKLRALHRYLRREDVSDGARKRALRAIKAIQYQSGIDSD
jgi:hypothetical protein